MSTVSFRETRRLFGGTNVPDFKINVRHRALLRKALEAWTPEELEATFGRPFRLRLTMGQAFNADELGKIYTNYVRNGRRVFNETPPPDPEVQDALRAYRTAYDSYFMINGHAYVIRNPAARPVLQAAEQAWHHFIVRYRAAHGMRARPTWALEPLPGLDRLPRVPALPAPAPAPTLAPRFLGVIDISDDEHGTPTRPAAQRRLAQLPTPPPSSPVTTNLSQLNDQPARRAPKRTFVDLTQSDDSDEEPVTPPRKKARFSGHIDLTI
ncbi:hypothetical protein B0H12DRAFT_1230203 [Mycena haematopus]|nr:hypothetical protein B0H12DRAFT_1230203 [Mycena haematopus]